MKCSVCKNEIDEYYDSIYWSETYNDYVCNDCLPAHEEDD